MMAINASREPLNNSDLPAWLYKFDTMNSLKVEVTQIFGLYIFSYFKNMGSNRGFHKVFLILAFAKHV